VAKKKASANGNGETIAGYFRKVFEENPKLLRGRSNQALLERWRQDHPGQALTTSVKVGLSNIKSVLRSKGRKRKARKATAGANAEVSSHTPAGPQPKPRLGVLEEAIDECLMMAKAADRQGLEPVIDLLRRARNLVVWKMGQPR
jgi:hypothetical protein